MSETKLSFIIPCYGSENTLEPVLQELTRTMTQNPAYDYEVVLVNDHSPDGVMEVIRRLCAQDERLTGIELARNFGQHAAIMAGLHYVSGDICVFLDDDGQTPVSQVFSLIAPLFEGYDMVYAKYPEKKHSLYRNLGSKVNDAMGEWLLGKPKNLFISSYFACRRYIAEEMKKYESPYPYLQGLVFRTCARITNVDIDHRSRLSGGSGYTFKKLIALWMNGFTAFSVKPLRIGTVLGVVSACFGFLLMIYVFINKLFINPDVPLGYSSTMSVLLFVGGILMLLLGLIGEYVGRMYISMNRSPQFVVRTVVRREGGD